MYKQDLALNYGGRVRCTRFTIGFADLQATSGAGAKSIVMADANNPSLSFTIPAFSKIVGASVSPQTSFTGGSLSAMTFSLGVSGALTRFTAAFDVFAAVSDTNLQETAMWKLGQKSALVGALLGTFTPTGDSNSNCTAGALFVDIYWVEQTTTGTLPA